MNSYRTRLVSAWKTGKEYLLPFQSSIKMLVSDLAMLPASVFSNSPDRAAYLPPTTSVLQPCFIHPIIFQLHHGGNNADKQDYLKNVL